MHMNRLLATGSCPGWHCLVGSGVSVSASLAGKAGRCASHTWLQPGLAACDYRLVAHGCCKGARRFPAHELYVAGRWSSQALTGLVPPTLAPTLVGKAVLACRHQPYQLLGAVFALPVLLHRSGPWFARARCRWARAGRDVVLYPGASWPPRPTPPARLVPCSQVYTCCLLVVHRPVLLPVLEERPHNQANPRWGPPDTRTPSRLLLALLPLLKVACLAARLLLLRGCCGAGQLPSTLSCVFQGQDVATGPGVIVPSAPPKQRCM